jgi:post-segregation antitoxin (ccd killing protein)
MQEKARGPKRSVNVLIDASLLDEATAAGKDMSVVLEKALLEELAAAKEHKRFLAETGSSNDEWRSI